jgi:hypothetical protein
MICYQYMTIAQGFVVTFPCIHIYIYTYIVARLVRPFHYPSSSPTPLLKMTLTVLYIHTYIESSSTMLVFLYPLHLPSPTISPYHDLCCISMRCIRCSVRILSVNILCFNQCNLFYYFSSPFPPYPVLLEEETVVRIGGVPEAVSKTRCHTPLHYTKFSLSMSAELMFSRLLFTYQFFSDLQNTLF